MHYFIYQNCSDKVLKTCKGKWQKGKSHVLFKNAFLQALQRTVICKANFAEITLNEVVKTLSKTLRSELYFWKLSQIAFES